MTTNHLPDASGLSAWRKSSYSGGEGGSCVEVADNGPGAVTPVRDSKNPAGPALLFSQDAWRGFVGAVKDDRFGGRPDGCPGDCPDDCPDDRSGGHFAGRSGGRSAGRSGGHSAGRSV
ncbi:DUF397 domain-containing protein [Streptomyces sp. NPDC007100]|uniref:DUF397 domain-containing protein n=1 Tax=Streptomyces sp. NPDC007100 TaxID=3155602 RepID=UPI0033EE213B